MDNNATNILTDYIKYPYKIPICQSRERSTILRNR